MSAALAEPSASRTECVIDARPGATLRLRLRFLGLQRRSVVDPDGTEHDRLEVDGVPHTAWEEGVPRQVDAAVALESLAEAPVTVDVTCPATTTSEEIRDATGALHGHLVRRAEAVSGRVVLATEPLPGPYGALRLRLDVVNDAVADPSTPRAAALRTALISAHTVLGLDRGAFLSSADPPQWAAPAVAACVNAHSWPVLAGPTGRRFAAARDADHPRGSPAARPGEPDEPVRRHRERRDPRAAHPRAHRRREARGPGHRPARRPHRRRDRRHGAGDVRAAARRDPPRRPRAGRHPDDRHPGDALVGPGRRRLGGPRLRRGARRRARGRRAAAR